MTNDQTAPLPTGAVEPYDGLTFHCPMPDNDAPDHITHFGVTTTDYFGTGAFITIDAAEFWDATDTPDSVTICLSAEQASQLAGYLFDALNAAMSPR